MKTEKKTKESVMAKIKAGEALWGEDLKVLINSIGEENIRFYVPMRISHVIPMLGIRATTSSDRTYLTECYISGARHKIEDGYKITLMACDQRFGSETFYMDDFAQMLGGKDPYVRLKLPGDRLEYVEEVWDEPIGSTGFVIRTIQSDFVVVTAA